MVELKEASRKATRDEWFVVHDWLIDEAEILDDRRMRDWAALLDEEIDYRVPVRLTRDRGHDGISAEGFHMLEGYTALLTRVERLETDYAWAEDPPSRTRRMVGNVRARRIEGEEALSVVSNLAVYRGRMDSPDFELLFGERHDLLVGPLEDLKLRRRVVLLDHTTLPAKNLAIFF